MRIVVIVKSIQLNLFYLNPLDYYSVTGKPVYFFVISFIFIFQKTPCYVAK